MLTALIDRLTGYLRRADHSGDANKMAEAKEAGE